MNDLPSDWSEQLQSVYPKRSGPSGWRSMKLMLALRRALFDSTWEQIIDGCKNYQKYCQAGGIEGSSFVQAPTRYIEDGSYLETFTHQTAEDPKRAELKRKEADYLERVTVRAGALGLSRYPDEPAAALETRCRLAETRGPDRLPDGLSTRVTDLAQRMRISK